LLSIFNKNNTTYMITQTSFNSGNRAEETITQQELNSDFTDSTSGHII